MMKKIFQITVLLLPVSLLFLGSSIYQRNLTVSIAGDQTIEFPENVKGIIDNKCYGCHNTESKAILAKGKMNWDDLPGMDKIKLISKVDKIIKVLEDGSMPPAKFVKQNQDKGLSDEERQILKDWAVSEADSLMKHP
jgi:uncharacterized membrane protein